MMGERKGAATFEFTLLLPFIIIVVTIACAFMLTLFSIGSYTSLASTLANDLNVRSRGLRTAAQMVDQNMTNSTVIIRGNKTSTPFSPEKTMEITAGQVKAGGSNVNSSIMQAYRLALIYHMQQHKEQFFLPYTKFEDIKVLLLRDPSTGGNGSDVKMFNTDAVADADKAIGEAKQKSLTNYIIKVEIHYTVLGIRMFGHNAFDGVPLTVNGWSVIT